MEWIPERIIELRDQLSDPTQQGLADALGVSRRVVQQWEAGQRPGPANARALDQLAVSLHGNGQARPLSPAELARGLTNKVLLAEVVRRFGLIPEELLTPGTVEVLRLPQRDLRFDRGDAPSAQRRRTPKNGRRHNSPE